MPQLYRAFKVNAPTITLLACLASAGLAPAASVSLAWDASPDTNVVGYALYSGTESGNFTQRLDLQTNLTATVTNLEAGTTYFFVVTAYTADQLESLPSNEVAYLVPGGFRLRQVSGAALAMLGIAGPTTEMLTLQASEDLKTWTNLYSLRPTTNLSFKIIDPESAHLPHRFYRLAGTNAPLPNLRFIRPPPASVARLEFVVATGSRVRIEASEDLVNWTLLHQHYQATNRWLEFIDPDSAFLPRRFYRLLPAD